MQRTRNLRDHVIPQLDIMDVTENTSFPAKANKDGPICREQFGKGRKQGLLRHSKS